MTEAQEKELQRLKRIANLAAAGWFQITKNARTVDVIEEEGLIETRVIDEPGLVGRFARLVHEDAKCRAAANTLTAEAQALGLYD